MTVNTVDSIAEFVTNGVTTNYPFYFKFLANEDLVVTYINPQGVSTQLVLGTNYTAHGAGNDDGGSIVTVAALAGPGQLVVSREMVAYQQTSLRNQGKFLAETHEDVFDRLTMLVQQGLAFARRALSRKPGKDFFDAENRNVSNLADPVALQDAVTRKWTQQYVGGLLQTGQGPANSAANILYTDSAGIPAVLQALVGNMIAGNLTVNVPGQFAEPADAMDWVRTKTIANGAKVTIKLADGVITLTRGTSLNHPQNSLIDLIGNVSAMASCQVAPVAGTTFDAFTCTSGCFGKIDGFRLSRPNKAGTGILALGADIARVGPNVEVDNFYYSYASRDGGRMQADDTVSRNAGDVGYWAYDGGRLGCKRAKAYDAIDVDSDLGYGFQAEYGGTLECEEAYATGCRKAGIAALAGGTVRAHNSNPSGNIGSGFLIRGASFIAMNGATPNNNGRWGVERESNGVVSGSYVGTGNTLGQQKPVALLVNENGVSAVASNTGATLGIGSNGPEGVVITVQGATALRAGSTGVGAVNFLQADAALSGQPVLVKARGADNIIDIELSPKNGHVRLPGYSAHADAPIVGCFEIMDTAGVIRRVAVIA
ncbi:hypothetical protein PspS35_19245 [Pseudomonas sp. S35]|uniref:hypothetical protein n=1 Tax=Pseudomonas sp. S35 TaxID=1573719 RepID=UPI00132F066F|nr:hypothetical protein [Pseudomonas sp. S35]QHF45824.1 hypothetical protein PspS35_19245 [Pseudomonas sp. S35]